MMTAGKNGKVLLGNWRRRMGAKGDAHLFPDYSGKPSAQPIGVDRRYPACGKRIPYGPTVVVRQGQPCTDCLVAALTDRAS